MEKVWVATVTHGDGTNIYLSKTDAGLRKQIANYCREWWPTEDLPPVDDQQVMNLYFDGDNDEFVEGFEEVQVGD